MARNLLPDERAALLERLAVMPVDADADDEVIETFLPGPQYERALDRGVLVVRGERGAGKTALFHLLHALSARGVALSTVIRGAPDGRRVVGYSERDLAHPPPDVVAGFASTATRDDLRAFWLAHLAIRLRAEGITQQDLPAELVSAYEASPLSLATWVQVARSLLAQLYAWFDGLERLAGETCYVIYDHLDRIGVTDRALRERVSSALLELWLSLSQRYQRLRGKVLLRDDLFLAALGSFADATKLESRSFRLDWNAGRLYALLVRRMAADPGLRGWLEDVADIELTQHPQLGWMPSSLDFDEATQRRLAKALVGEFMGKGPTKGFSYKWLINHLQDAHAGVTPRSLLYLVRGAAERAKGLGPRAAWRRLLHPSELRSALESASRRRVAELQEDFPVVGRLEGLRDATLFVVRREALKALASVKIGDGFEGRPEDAYNELIRLGVLSVRTGRVDVPDVFRFAFGIKRKGGVRTVA
jgi:hypothetical protein